MSQEQWTAVDRYITERLVPSDPVLDAALADCAAAGLPPIAVSPPQGKQLYLLARMLGALDRRLAGRMKGISQKSQAAYAGPCPPAGSEPHRYRFTLYALRRPLRLTLATAIDELRRAMKGLVAGRAELVGRLMADPLHAERAARGTKAATRRYLRPEQRARTRR